MNKKKFMFKRLLADIKAPKDRYVINYEKGPELKEYYFVFDEARVKSGLDQSQIAGFNENGIPYNRSYVDIPGVGNYYSPITVGQMGLAVYHTYLKAGRDSDKERFLKFVDWFYESAISTGVGHTWPTFVPLPQYKKVKPWRSAFANSRAISILLRGYQLTGDNALSIMAQSAITPFYFPTWKGGVSLTTEYGPFFEEYVADVDTMVLNGHIFSLFGLLDYLRLFPQDLALRHLFNDGVNCLAEILKEYDLGYWSRYHLCEGHWYPSIDPATINYHRLHIQQLSLLYVLTGRQEFKKYRDIFKAYDKPINWARMYWVKYKALKKLGRI